MDVEVGSLLQMGEFINLFLREVVLSRYRGNVAETYIAVQQDIVVFETVDAGRNLRQNIDSLPKSKNLLSVECER